MAIEYLSNNPDGASVNCISEDLSIPFDSVARVLQKLSKKDFVQATLGVKGGYQLSKKIKNLNYVELTEIIEGKPFYSDCEDQKCNYLTTCNIKGPVKTINHKAIDFFKNIKINDLLGVNI